MFFCILNSKYFLSGKENIFYAWIWNITRIRAKFWNVRYYNYDYIVKNGRIKHLKATDLQFIDPTEYVITKPATLTIFEYKVNEIASKSFYIKEYNQKYNLKEIKQILIKLKI